MLYSVSQGLKGEHRGRSGIGPRELPGIEVRIPA
jgi:hypothetical protein